MYSSISSLLNVSLGEFIAFVGSFFLILVSSFVGIFFAYKIGFKAIYWIMLLIFGNFGSYIFGRYNYFRGANADYKVYKGMDSSNPMKQVLVDKYKGKDYRFK